jgi:hypothetical protein
MSQSVLRQRAKTITLAFIVSLLGLYHPAWGQPQSATQDEAPFVAANRSVETLQTPPTKSRANQLWPSDRKARIWSAVTVHEGADLWQLRETMSQTRDEVRNGLWDQLSALAPRLMTEYADPSQLAKTLAGILLSFDRVHDQHKKTDKKNFDATLSAQILSGFERFMRANRLVGNQRRAEFVGASAGALNYLQGTSKLDVEGIKQALTELQPGGIDFLVAITWSGVGPQVQLQLQLERIETTFDSAGRVATLRTYPTTVTIQGSWVNAGELAGFELARLFQEFQDPPLVDPAPQLQWITHFVREGSRPLSHTQGRSVCATQGARLPYAIELLNAEKFGEFQMGGRAALNPNAFFVIADRLRLNMDHFVHKAAETSPTGPIINETGYGRLEGWVFCVIGAPSAAVIQTNAVWGALREARLRHRKVVENALEYLLMQIGAVGAYNPTSFSGEGVLRMFETQTPEQVLRLLQQNGVNLDLSAFGLQPATTP